MRKSALLRKWYEEGRFFVSAGINNALEAKIGEAAGYDAVGMSGAGTAALCGYPDAGITTLTEVVNNARYIVNSVSVPVMVDGETGFGNIHALRRAVREIISTGAASMFIEDQADLRRCGFIAGKRVLPIDEALAKYRAAVDVRNEMDRDFVLTARCDARGAAGGSLADAIRRGQAYKSVGIDVLYYEALQSMEEIKACIAEVGPPIYFTFGAIAMDERPSHQEMAALGIANAHYWLLRPLRNYPVDRLMWEMLHDVKERGAKAMQQWNEWAASFPWKRSEPPHFHDFMGFADIREVERKYLPPEEQTKYEESLGLYTPGENPEIRKKGVEWR
jgi:2-methylisocitrate lyase-like PEP mutase family enzyme